MCGGIIIVTRFSIFLSCGVLWFPTLSRVIKKKQFVINNVKEAADLTCSLQGSITYLQVYNPITVTSK